MAATEPHLVVPVFTNYYDYDFRNLQAYELLEDLFWETQYSAYTQLEYLTLADAAAGKVAPDVRTALREPYFLQTNLNPTGVEMKDEVVGSDRPEALGAYAGGVNFDDYITALPTLSTDQISTFQLSANLFNLEDSYEQWSEGRTLLNGQQANFCLVNPRATHAMSYLTNFNSFNSEFED